jgi:hypothetical protein
MAPRTTGPGQRRRGGAAAKSQSLSKLAITAFKLENKPAEDETQSSDKEYQRSERV